MEYTKKQIIKIVTDCANKYASQLLNKSLLFITFDKHKNTSAIEVFFEKRNYLHLTGLVVDKQVISAERFFELCIAKKLSQEDIGLREDGTTNLKLQILPILMKKNLSANSVGNYNDSGLDLYTEKIAGGIKGCMGFRTDSVTKRLVPNTVLNKDIRQCTKAPQDRIIATFRKDQAEGVYSEVVYIAKKVEWNRVKFPEEYTYLLKYIKK